MLIFTILWVSQVSNPVVAYWLVTHYTGIVAGDSFNLINNEVSLNYWLEQTVIELLYRNERSGIVPVGKLCMTEYYAEAVPC